MFILGTQVVLDKLMKNQRRKGDKMKTSHHGGKPLIIAGPASKMSRGVASRLVRVRGS